MKRTILAIAILLILGFPISAKELWNYPARTPDADDVVTYSELPHLPGTRGLYTVDFSDLGLYVLTNTYTSSWFGLVTALSGTCEAGSLASFGDPAELYHCNGSMWVDISSSFNGGGIIKINRIEPTFTTQNYLVFATTETALNGIATVDLRVGNISRLQVGGTYTSFRSGENKLSRSYGALTTPPLCTIIYAGSDYFNLTTNTLCTCSSTGSWIVIGPVGGSCP